MCYEFSLFSNLSRVARFYIDGVSGSEKYAVASAVSRTSGQAAWHLFVLSVDHQTESFEVQSAKIGYWPHIDDTKHFLYFWFPMSYFSKASSTWINCLLFPNRYFYKGSYLPVPVGGFCTQPEIPEFKRKKIDSQTVNSGLNSILQRWGVTAWVGEGGVVFNLIWESIKSWDWVWKVKQRKYIRCTDMLEMDLRGQWATVGQIPIFSFLLHPWWCSRSQTCP